MGRERRVQIHAPPTRPVFPGVSISSSISLHLGSLRNRQGVRGREQQPSPLPVLRAGQRMHRQTDVPWEGLPGLGQPLLEQVTEASRGYPLQGEEQCWGWGSDSYPFCILQLLASPPSPCPYSQWPLLSVWGPPGLPFSALSIIHCALLSCPLHAPCTSSLPGCEQQRESHFVDQVYVHSSI